MGFQRLPCPRLHEDPRWTALNLPIPRPLSMQLIFMLPPLYAMVPYLLGVGYALVYKATQHFHHQQQELLWAIWSLGVLKMGAAADIDGLAEHRKPRTKPRKTAQAPKSYLGGRRSLAGATCGNLLITHLLSCFPSAYLLTYSVTHSPTHIPLLTPSLSLT